MDAPTLDIAAVLEHYSADPVRMPPEGSDWRSIKCPFHDDMVASGRVSRKRNAYKCLGCDVSGDSWKLIKHMEGVDFVGALKFAERHLGHESERVQRPNARRPKYRGLWT